MSPLALPAVVDAFLKQPNAAVIGCVRPDRFPMTVITWYDWEGGRFLVNMNAARRRLGWIRLNPKVSLTIFDDDWYRHVSVWGEVVEIKEDSDLADIDRLARRYTGKPFGNRTGKRVSAWIDPHGWHGWDDSGELASARA